MPILSRHPLWEAFDLRALPYSLYALYHQRVFDWLDETLAAPAE